MLSDKNISKKKAYREISLFVMLYTYRIVLTY
jgi:hypothetical protein